MTRLLGWFGVAAIALAGHLLDNAALRATGVPALLLLFTAGAPRSLRAMLLLLTAATLALILAGFADRLLDATPALIAGLVGWLFGRTLLRGRRPLIARAIAAIDGEEPLADPVVARYARRLTGIWAAYQGALASIGLLLAVRAWICPLALPMLPGPRLFGILVLPAAVVALLLVEFALRRRLLPQVPRRSLTQFVSALIRSWPALLRD